MASANLILDTVTKSGGVTISTTAHRVQSAADGSPAALSVICRELTTASDGTVLSDKFPAGAWLNVPLSPGTVTALQADIASAFAALP